MIKKYTLTGFKIELKEKESYSYIEFLGKEKNIHIFKVSKNQKRKIAFPKVYIYFIKFF